MPKQDTQKQISRYQKWMKSKQKILFDHKKYKTILIIGNPHQGKSACAEWYFEHLIRKGHIPFDLYGSIDLEALAWATKYKCLIIKPNYLDCATSNKNIEFIDHTEKISTIIKRAKQERRIVVIGTGLWWRNGHIDLNLIPFLADFMQQLIRYNMKAFNNIAVLQREAGDLYSPRFKLFGEYTKQIERVATFFFRQVGHAKSFLILDNQRYMGMVSDMRDLIDIIIIKRTSNKNFPPALDFVPKDILTLRATYSFSLSHSLEFKKEQEAKHKKTLTNFDLNNIARAKAKKRYPLPQELQKNQFIAVFDDDSILHGTNDLPSFEHHDRYGNKSMFDKLKLKIKENGNKDPYAVSFEDSGYKEAIVKLIHFIRQRSEVSFKDISLGILEGAIPRRTLNDWYNNHYNNINSLLLEDD